MVNRMRSTRSHTRNRRSHHALKPQRLVKCKKCGEEIYPHTLCLNCGFYDDVEVVDVFKKLTKKEKKEKEKELNKDKES